MPTNSEIISALGTGGNCLRTHKSLQPLKRPNGEYYFSTGNFSLVVKMHDTATGKYYAMKCFTKLHPKLIDSYTLIGKHIQLNQSPYLVHYEFCENEIWVSSELDGTKGYPVVIMEWIEGKTLGSYLAELVAIADKEALFQLACRFDALSLWLLEQPFAHGDLKTDNILVDPSGRLRLIDYDGMFTPEMQNQHARENGSPGFRHPKRLQEHFGPHIDDFSILIISLSLHALASIPALAENDNSFSDSILFTEEGLCKPEHSIWQLFETLRDNSHVAQRLVMLQMAAGNPATMRLFGIKPILQVTACFASLIMVNEEIPDEDIEKYVEYRENATVIYYGFIQKSTGKIICKAIYDAVSYFSEGLAGVKLKGKCGFINKSGKIIISITYDQVRCFSKGLGKVNLHGKWGLIDKTEKVIISLIYNDVRSCSNGLVLCILNSKYGFINTSNKVVIPMIYDCISDFSDGLALVYLNKKWGFIDKSGKVIIPIIYDSANSFSEGFACAGLNRKVGFIDKTGTIVIPMIYNIAFPFSRGLARVELNGKYGWIDKKGIVIIPLIYNITWNFSKELAHVVLNGKYGLIDKAGKAIIPLIYECCGSFTDGLAAVRLNGKYGYIDETDNLIIPIIYSSAENFHEGMSLVGLNGKYGWINKTGNIIIPLIYGYAESFSQGLAWVELNDKYGWIDKAGKRLWE